LLRGFQALPAVPLGASEVARLQQAERLRPGVQPKGPRAAAPHSAEARQVPALALMAARLPAARERLVSRQEQQGRQQGGPAGEPEQTAWPLQELWVSRGPVPAAQFLEPQATPQRASKPWLPEQRALPRPLRRASAGRLWPLLL
jgi:hypothetical protein